MKNLPPQIKLTNAQQVMWWATLILWFCVGVHRGALDYRSMTVKEMTVEKSALQVFSTNTYYCGEPNQ